MQDQLKCQVFLSFKVMFDVYTLSLKFFEFHHESLIKFVKDAKIVPATYLENNKGLNNKIKRL
jgi:hypothetical protein